AIPKSITLTWPSKPSIRLSGLTSRWTRPSGVPLRSRSSCAAWRPRHASAIARAATAGGGRSSTTSRNARPATDSITMYSVRPALLAEVVHRRDAGVVEPREDRGLVEEHRAHRLRRRELGPDRLDRDELLECARATAAPEQHRAHAAGLQLVEDLVGAEPRSH